jgi:hypothetical protein
MFLKHDKHKTILQLEKYPLKLWRYFTMLAALVVEAY